MKLTVNEQEASERYGMSVHWFRRKRWAGGGPEYLKVGSRCLYPVDKLDAYFTGKLTTSTSQAA